MTATKRIAGWMACGTCGWNRRSHEGERCPMENTTWTELTVEQAARTCGSSVPVSRNESRRCNAPATHLSESGSAACDRHLRFGRLCRSSLVAYVDVVDGKVVRTMRGACLCETEPGTPRLADPCGGAVEVE